MQHRAIYLILAIAMIKLPFGLFAEPLAVGAEAPRLTATIHTGDKLDLGERYDQGPVLVFFYPRAETAGCTAQACNLRDHDSDLREAGIQVIGVSRDNVERQAAFQTNHELPFPLIADESGDVVAAFGVPTAMGIPRRQTFLVVDGKIAWRDLSATPRTQSEDALAAFRALQEAD